VLRPPEQSPQAGAESEREAAPSEPAQEAPQESAPAQEAQAEREATPEREPAPAQEAAPTQEATPEESGPVVSGARDDGCRHAPATRPSGSSWQALGTSVVLRVTEPRGLAPARARWSTSSTPWTAPAAASARTPSSRG